VDPRAHRVVKFWPDRPVVRNDIVLVDGERCRVRRVREIWDGPEWTLLALKVRPEPLP